MNLTTALRLGSTPRVALVGSGGKTTALFALAREAASPAPAVKHRQVRTVIVAATAHMAIDQTALADQHFSISTPDDLAQFEAQLPDGITLFTGPSNDTGKTIGLMPDTARAVKELADHHHAPMFIEADGSKGLPLKAPADQEPPIPEFVDEVICVAGLSGLGQPLNDEHVHRPDRFARLSGLASGDAITPEAITKVLRDPIGGLKNIPSSARRIVLLNQADTSELQTQAQVMARQVLPTYQAVIIAALKDKKVFAVQEPTAGIILAAGASIRMGQPKQLLMWRGEPFVRHVARIALEAGLSPVMIVAGAHLPEIRAVVADLPVSLVYNGDWAAGQSTSVQCGVRALPDEIGSAIFLLADQPHIPIGLVKALSERHAQSLAPIVAPLIGDRRGNPALFDRNTFDDLLSLSGDVGGRAVFERYPISHLPWEDANLLLDVDTPEDYQRLKELENRHSP